MAQDALDRWWWPSLMMFGPNDANRSTPRNPCAGRSSASPTTSCASSSSTSPCRRRSSSACGFRIRSCNGTRRASTIASAPSTGREFQQVLKGNGPCNRERLEARRRAHEGGALGARGGARPRREASPARNAGGMKEHATMTQQKQWPLYEVFIRARSGLEHKHVGSLHAADARMAIEHARDVYTRRQEGVSIWVVRFGRHHRIRSGGRRCVVRAGAGQGLSAPDVLRHSG